MERRRLRRIIGRMVYISFARYLPVSYHYFGHISRRLRATCGKLMLDYCGNNVNIERMAQFSSRIRIGDNSGIGINAVISAGTEIGSNVMMGPNCTIYSRNHCFDRTDVPMLTQGFQNEKKVVIRDDVWIGGDVIILPGVTVGKGAIIGAGAVVSKNVPDYAIVVGNPAHIVKYRSNGRNDNDV